MEEQNFFDIYPLVGKSFDDYFNMRVIIITALIVVGVILLVGIIVYKVYKYFVSPRYKAQKELLKLRKQPCLTHDEAKGVFSSIAAIVKQFLIKKYGIKNIGMTDAEFISFLQTKLADKGILRQAERLLLETGAIRFSHDAAHARMCDQLIQDALAFVQRAAHK